MCTKNSKRECSKNDERESADNSTFTDRHEGKTADERVLPCKRASAGDGGGGGGVL